MTTRKPPQFDPDLAEQLARAALNPDTNGRLVQDELGHFWSAERIKLHRYLNPSMIVELAEEVRTLRRGLYDPMRDRCIAVDHIGRRCERGAWHIKQDPMHSVDQGNVVWRDPATEIKRAPE